MVRHWRFQRFIEICLIWVEDLHLIRIVMGPGGLCPVIPDLAPLSHRELLAEHEGQNRTRRILTMIRPTTPKPAPAPCKSAKARRRKFRPADRFRSVGCQPMGTDKLVEPKSVLDSAIRYREAP